MSHIVWEWQDSLSSAEIRRSKRGFIVSTYTSQLGLVSGRRVLVYFTKRWPSGMDFYKSYNPWSTLGQALVHTVNNNGVLYKVLNTGKVNT